MSSIPIRTSDLDILIIGKTGNGKSATGNTILGRKAFETSPSFNSLTKVMQYEFSLVDGSTLKVVDGPGVCDTEVGLSEEEALRQMFPTLHEAIATNPEGYHAFLLTIRLGGRFTAEDLQTINVLKGVFGEGFVRSYCILVVTCGDSYDPEETGYSSFDDWCMTQTGVFRTLVEECNKRVILFDNRTKDETKLKSQRNRLIRMIQGLSVSGERYSDKHFELARKERDRLVVQSKFGKIREESLKTTSLVLQELGRVQLKDPEQQIEPLHDLGQTIDGILASIKSEDLETGVLEAIVKNVSDIKSTIEEQLSNALDAIEIKERQELLRQEIEMLRLEREEQQRQLDEGERWELERKIRLMEEKRRCDQIALERMSHSQNVLKSHTEHLENEFRKIRRVRDSESISSICGVVATVLPALLNAQRRSL